MLDFEILKTLTSQKNVDIKGRSFRSFTDIIAEVRFFYFLRDNKHFKHVQRDLQTHATSGSTKNRSN